MSAEERGGLDRARSDGRPSRRTLRGRPDRRPTEQNRRRSDRPGRLEKCWTCPPLLIRRLWRKKKAPEISRELFDGAVLVTFAHADSPRGSGSCQKRRRSRARRWASWLEVTRGVRFPEEGSPTSGRSPGTRRRW